MRIRAGFRLSHSCPAPTPMLLMLNVHPSREADLVTRDELRFDQMVRPVSYVDSFGNRCTRIVAPAGRMSVSTEFEIEDTGAPDTLAPEAEQHDVADLPPETLMYLLASRYCESDQLAPFAWASFSHVPAGWARVQAICDFVHAHLTFDYQRASPMRTAQGAYLDRTGVCRDFAHLAITLCRAMNIPARYCTGYLGDIGIPPVPYPMDFSAWFDVYLGGAWHTFDARHNTPRIGRILMARGRDATDVALSTSFGATLLTEFQVFTDEMQTEAPRRAARG